MSTLAPDERNALKILIEARIADLHEDIASLKEAVKPIAPDCAIGRLSRMDAINSKSVNEELLRTSQRRLQLLERALQRADSPQFGLCTRCGKPIPFGRLEIMPESIRCAGCVG